MRTSLIRTLLFVSAFLLLPAAAYAGYVSVTDLAQSGNLSYHDMSTGDVHACKLIGGGREVMILGGMRSIVIDGKTTALAQAVRWDGKTLLIPDEAVALITSERVPEATPSAQNEDEGAAAVPGASAAPVRSIPAARTALRKPSSNRQMTVVVDAGHGGKDPGTTGFGLEEKDLNLDVARRVSRYLEERGVKVIMTRSRDVFIELDDRVDIANRAHPDLFLAIHTNWMPESDLHGVMVIYPDDGIGNRPGIIGRARDEADDVNVQALGAGGPISKTLQLAVATAAVENFRLNSIDAAFRIQNAIAPVTGIYEGHGVTEDPRGLRVLRGTLAPAVIVEMDFLSNRAAGRKLATVDYRSKIADAIGAGTISYLEANAAAEGN